MNKMVRLICLWATLGCGAAWGQSDGFIEGTVTGEAGEALPGANIAVRSPADDYKAGTTADADGQFRISVPAGNYQVEITFVGYKSDLRENVQVRAGQTTRLDAVLVEQVIFLAQSVVSASRRQEKILDAPASVSVVEGREIRNNPALSLSDHVKNLPAVDIAKRGLANANVVVRGFNNIFSGSLLTLTDNRIARVPSLRVNALNFIPLTNDDVERIEVVLGPGSALYGPNSADGVMHIITHSPFTSQGTNVHVGMGERNLRHTTIRHAGVVGDRLGYKISGQYYTGTEWEYTDPEEVKAQALRQAEIDAGAEFAAPQNARSHHQQPKCRSAPRLAGRGRLDGHLGGGTQQGEHNRGDRRGSVADHRLAVQLRPVAAAVPRLVLPGLPQLERRG